MTRTLITVALVVVSTALLYVPARDVPLRFDSISYAAQAASLAGGDGNTVEIGDGRLHPGIYPIGVPLLAAPPIALTGDLRAGIWSILVCGVVCVLVTAAVTRRVAGPAAGFLAALLLLSSGAFRACAAEIFSQVPTALAVVGTAWLFVTARGSRRLAGAGALAVLSVLLRNANAGFPLALLLTAWATGPSSRGRRLTAVVAGMVPAGLLVLAHNAWMYGSPWVTGYEAWGWAMPAQFSLQNIIGWDEAGAVRGRSLVNFLGFGRLYSVPVLLAASVAVARSWRRRDREPIAARLAVLTTTAVAAQYAVHLPHAFYAHIYFVPTVPLVAATAALGVQRLCWPAPDGDARSPVRLDRRVAAAMVVAVALVALSVAGDEPRSASDNTSVATYESLRAASRAAEPDAVLLTASDPSLVDPLWLDGGTGREVLHLVDYLAGPLEDLDRLDFGADGIVARRVVERTRALLREGRPVYLSRWTPPRGAGAARRRAIHAALRKRLELVPTDIEQVVRVELSSDAD